MSLSRVSMATSASEVNNSTAAITYALSDNYKSISLGDSRIVTMQYLESTKGVIPSSLQVVVRENRKRKKKPDLFFSMSYWIDSGYFNYSLLTKDLRSISLNEKDIDTIIQMAKSMNPKTLQTAASLTANIVAPTPTIEKPKQTTTTTTTNSSYHAIRARHDRGVFLAKPKPTTGAMTVGQLRR